MLTGQHAFLSAVATSAGRVPGGESCPTEATLSYWRSAAALTLNRRDA
jgi:hypothetical protein